MEDIHVKEQLHPLSFKDRKINKQKITCQTHIFMCEKPPISVSLLIWLFLFVVVCFFFFLWFWTAKLLSSLNSQKMKLNLRNYSIFTSTVSISIHILELSDNKDFYLYKSNEMKKNLTTPTKVKYKQE